MSQHATSDNSNAIGLFPFLAVLLCTMGALLVVLVTLAQRAAEQAVAERMQASADAKPPTAIGYAADFVRQLDEVHEYLRKLQELRKQGESRLHEEQARLSHLEEHTRRLEHELARLALAAQQLEATEQHQLVDHEQAATELKRLRQLITDTEKQLDELREQGTRKHSYAVVPYQGQNGTLRKPIYIECSAKGIILQPEGLRFERSDFADPTWPGNPLAAALRASREYLNNQAALAGKPDPPDPYPLILVRPDGITSYQLARLAITSWDSDFGYEFIDTDWKIDYPDLPDPQLARAQQHAVMIARERLQRLVQAAPSQFRGAVLGSGKGGSSASASSGGYGFGGEGTGSAEGGDLAQADGSQSATGNGSAAGGQDEPPNGSGEDDPNSSQGQFQYGAVAGEASSGTVAGGPEGQSPPGELASARGPSGPTGPTNGSSQSSGQAGGGSATAMAQAGSTSGASVGAASSSMSQPANPADANAEPRPSLQIAPQASIAESRGSDWAVQKAMRSAIPVRRTIRVVVRQNQLALLPSRHAADGAEATGTAISLDQSLDRISDEFVAALKTRIDEWGLAGNGLYWRPVLELYVGPDAGETAARLNHLLRDSGVEVRLPETAQSQQGDSAHAPR